MEARPRYICITGLDTRPRPSIGSVIRTVQGDHLRAVEILRRVQKKIPFIFWDGVGITKDNCQAVTGVSWWWISKQIRKGYQLPKLEIDITQVLEEERKYYERVGNGSKA